ncbi:MAG: IS21 family transposase, partial [Candidatus Competibacteraceae bacterium]|nr:IS21 family transposase [Candidatus Competibacteraceae bacterium]
MHKIVDILRLHAAGYSQEQIGHRCGLNRSTVGEYLARARQAGLSWPLPERLSETEVEQRLFPAPVRTRHPIEHCPDWAKLHHELRRPGVTLELLWQVYRERQPQGYSYSRFCELYRIWAAKADMVIRHLHRAGEKLFVDYARQTIPIINRHSGERLQAQIFVAVLGASNYTFAEATWIQQPQNWLQSHVRAFAFFGGVPEVVVPGSLKTGVVKAHRYRPNLNLSHMELAKHYQFTIIPARIRRPRDKATVEVGISVVERWIL